MEPETHGRGGASSSSGNPRLPPQAPPPPWGSHADTGAPHPALMLLLPTATASHPRGGCARGRGGGTGPASPQRRDDVEGAETEGEFSLGFSFSKANQRARRAGGRAGGGWACLYQRDDGASPGPAPSPRVSGGRGLCSPGPVSFDRLRARKAPNPKTSSKRRGREKGRLRKRKDPTTENKKTNHQAAGPKEGSETRSRWGDGDSKQPPAELAQTPPWGRDASAQASCCGTPSP